jgi:hypothetical protein
MKKYLLLFIILVLAQAPLLAQSLELMKKDGSAITEDTIYIKTNNGSSTLEAPVYVKNTSNKAIDVLVNVYVKSIMDESSASYCWGGSCFDILTSPSTSHTTIESADTAKEFHSDLSPNNQVGLSEIMFTFYNKNNSDDSVSVTVYYELFITGLDPFSEIKESIRAFPNPVQNTLFLSYNNQNTSDFTISIFDIVGKKVKSQKLVNNESVSEIDVSIFKQGIYIWTLESNGIPIKSQKFIKK